ncbi:MAG: cyclic nucleotide-binding domain-containing protein [Gammaproteobacteria bacterium]|nr:cyclic nucleotide-binding domain-containing protein [Gammaproteobacteria bacterium]
MSEGDRESETNAVDMESVFQQADKLAIAKGEIIFSEGDTADYVYYIQSGQVVVTILQFTKLVELCQLGKGQLFGEMGIVNESKRSATVRALEDCQLLAIDTQTFTRCCQQDPNFTFGVQQLLHNRLNDLVGKENLLANSGAECSNLSFSIKGDPSLRESIFTRARYESVVDTIMPQLIKCFIDLLLNYSVHQIYIHFNSGEVGLSTIFDPFEAEIHPANKLIDHGYLDRHFSKIAYAEKLNLIKRLNGCIEMDHVYQSLPDNLKKMQTNGTPVTPAQINTVISRLTDLRNIPDLYLRNFTFNITRDAVRMQFNCDGTHVVSSSEYIKFIEVNLIPAD